MSTTEENKAAFRRTFEELFNQGNYAIVEGLLAPDYFSCASEMARVLSTGQYETIWG